jgi:transcriptional regulator with XRE-family HTH domain
MNNEWNMKGFSERLAECLRQKGWTMADLSRKSDVPKATIHHWTCGKVPKITQLVKVVNVLEVSLHELCFGTPDPFERRSSSSEIDTKIGSFKITIEHRGREQK